jgi:hypothetical protein
MARTIEGKRECSAEHAFADNVPQQAPTWMLSVHHGTLRAAASYPSRAPTAGSQKFHCRGCRQHSR